MGDLSKAGSLSVLDETDEPPVFVCALENSTIAEHNKMNDNLFIP